MSQQLAYVIITPYSLHKSRTGGILARLISRTSLEMAGARMFAPSPELVQEYSKAIVSANDPQDRRIQELIRDYILQNLSPDPKTKRRRRVMVLLFQGEDAVRKVRSVVGNISADRRGGETIRDTYGDLILDEHGQVRYFEPAVLAAPNAEEAELKLKLWGRYSGTDGGFLANTMLYPPGEKPEHTLVLIKPEKALGELLGPLAGDQQFENIVKFMSGRAPSECDSVTLQQPGSEKCIAVVYEGHEAIRKIRDVLGPTDPSKAPPGSIRREFGSTIMVNAAHASDSVENARREMGIVRIGQENIFHKVIEEFYGKP